MQAKVILTLRDDQSIGSGRFKFTVNGRAQVSPRKHVCYYLQDYRDAMKSFDVDEVELVEIEVNEFIYKQQPDEHFNNNTTSATPHQPVQSKTAE